MKFWDSSALVPLLAVQAQTPFAEQTLAADPEVTAWWGSPVECASAIARLEREKTFDGRAATAALERLRALSAIWDEVQPTLRLRERAQRLQRAHALRAADALQLAAALEGSANDPSGMDFVCLDERLSDAAAREGFRVVGGENEPRR